MAQARDLYRITKSVRKYDNNDSMELAFYMRRRLYGENEFAECVIPTHDWMMRREICRTVTKEKLHLANLKRRARSHMLLHGIKLSREYRDIFSKKAIQEMERSDDICLRIIEVYVDSHRDDVEKGRWRMSHYRPDRWDDESAEDARGLQGKEG